MLLQCGLKPFHQGVKSVMPGRILEIRQPSRAGPNASVVLVKAFSLLEHREAFLDMPVLTPSVLGVLVVEPKVSLVGAVCA